MALLAMLCFYTFFGGKKAWFVIFGTAMLLTKESGGVFFVALFLYECSIFVTVPQKDWKGLFKKLSLVCLPVAIASVNFIIQKIKFGWFLYPFYIDYISSSPKPFAAKLATVAAYTFVYDGRNGFSVFIILSLFAMFIFKKLRMKEKERSVLFALSLFVVLYLIFSTVNYYIPRYLMCVFPPMYIIGALLIDRVFSKFKSVLALIILGLVITSVFFYMQPKTYGDIDYSPSVVTDWQMVKFCEDQNLYDNYIFTTTLLRGDLSEPYEGYLSGRKFEHTQWELNNQTEYCIFSADENDSALFDKIKKEKRLVLLKRFEQKYAWCEVYKVIN